MRLSSPLLLWSVIGLWSVARAHGVEISADQIESADGQVIGSGGVEFAFADTELGRAYAERFTFDQASGSLVLEEGFWEGSEGRVVFQQAEMNVGPEYDLLGFEHAEATLCQCDAPPWKIEARSVTVQLDKKITVSGGWVQICDHRVLPFPKMSVPLADRKTGLLWPSLGWSEDGLRASVPLFATLGQHADVTLTPEYFGDRGVRGMGEFRVGLGPAVGTTVQEVGISGGIGNDRTADPDISTRGFLEVHETAVAGIVRTGMELQWLSDSDYLQDYGSTFETRVTPWSEMWGFAGVGPVRVESLGFQAFEEVTQRPMGVVAAMPGIKVGPASMSGVGRVDLYGGASTPWCVKGGTRRTEAQAAMHMGQMLGAVNLRQTVKARHVAWSDGDDWQDVQGVVEGALPVWGDVGPIRHIGEIGLVAAMSGYHGVPDIRLLEDRVPAPISFGPQMSSRWLTTAGAPIRIMGSLPWNAGFDDSEDGASTVAGFQPEATVLARWGQWDFQARGVSALQSVGAQWSDSVTQVTASVVHLAEIEQNSEDVFGYRSSWHRDGGAEALLLPVWGGLQEELAQGRSALSTRLPYLADDWHIGWMGFVDLSDKVELLSQGPTFRYSSRCECLAVTASANWSQDQTLPQLLVRLDVQPD